MIRKRRIVVAQTLTSHGPHYWLDYIDPDKCLMELVTLGRKQTSIVNMALQFQIGIVGHALFEAYFKLPQRDRKAFDPFDVRLVNVDGTPLEVSGEALADATLCVAVALEDNPFAEYRTLAVEHAFEPRLIGNTLVGGRADLLLADDRHIIVVDHKFVAEHPTRNSISTLQERYRNSIALATYADHAAIEYERPAHVLTHMIFKGALPSRFVWEYSRCELPAKKVLKDTYTKAIKASLKPRRNFAACGKGTTKCKLFQQCVRYSR